MAVADLILGPARVWYAPVGETLPSENTVAYGASWGGNWAAFGYTKTPLSAKYAAEFFDAKIIEALGPVKRARTSEDLTLETTLSELTATNLQLGTDGVKTVTAAGAGQVGMEEVEVGGDSGVDYHAFGFEGLYETDAGLQFPIRLFIYKGHAVLNGALEFGKSDYPGITLQLKAFEDLSKAVGKRLFKFQKVTAAATS